MAAENMNHETVVNAVTNMWWLTHKNVKFCNVRRPYSAKYSQSANKIRTHRKIDMWSAKRNPCP